MYLAPALPTGIILHILMGRGPAKHRMMKKLWILLLWGMSLTTYTTYAQRHVIGVQAGVNYGSTIHPAHLTDPLFKAGLKTGINYQLRLNDRWNLGTDVLFTQRGARIEIPILGPYGELLGVMDDPYIAEYTYVSVPIKVGITFGNTVGGFVNLGLAPSFLITAQNIMPNNLSSWNTESKVDISGRINPVDLSAILETGLSYRMHKSWKLLATGGFQQSLTNMSNLSIHNQPDFSLRAYTFSLSVGVHYLFHKN